MKRPLIRLFTVLALGVGLFRVQAQGTAFTYQGRLQNGTNAANGNYDLTFALFTAGSGGVQVGSTLTNLDVGVTNGLFTVIEDFGAVYNGAAYWLQIGVRTNGAATFTPLSPLQELTPTPYSITAQHVTGAIPLAQLPAGLVTNNESGVTLSNVTVSGDLSLPLPAIIETGGTSLLYADNQYNFFAGLYAGNDAVTGLYNTGVGFSALESITSGDYNTAFGMYALQNNTTGGLNTATGVEALWYNTTGVWNTANGVDALYSNTNGSYNTAVGLDALAFNTSGSNNIALGYTAGENIGTGSSNIDIGHPGVSGDNMVIRIGSGQTATYIAGTIYGNGAGLTNLPNSSLLDSPGNENFFAGPSSGNSTMAGAFNTGVGDRTLAANANGGGNTAVGTLALESNTNGNNNSALGADALAFNTSGSFNTGLGLAAIEYSSTGSYNTGIGAYALEWDSTGSYNTGTGAYALSDYYTSYVTGNDNTADGAYALADNENGVQNTAVGYGALATNTSGNYNTATGVGALGNNTASYNAAFGADALVLNSSGSNNAAVGASALAFNQTGSSDTAVGYAALALNTTGANNTAVGIYAMGGAFSSSGANTAIGGMSLYEITDGYNNTAAGYEALQADSTGVDNVGIGVATFQMNSAGSANTACGTYAFQYLTAGNGNIGLGYAAGNSLNTGTNNIYIGNDGQNSESGVIRIGTPGTQTQTFLAGPVTCCSITITGGCDLAEPFEISSKTGEIPEGAVVVIDEQNPGQLKVSNLAYDTRVAGVLSGANGIHPGIQMQQHGALEAGKNVALSGRVYVLADASNGAIKPGDLLTTSDIPGHAMKVSDHMRAQGAILGKAMTGLSEGNGMVLVLVTLQ